MKRLIVVLLGVAFASLSLPAMAQTKSTLESVHDRGYVTCGITERMPGFSSQDPSGNWSGFNVDYCRALGAAIFDNVQAVQLSNYWLDALVGNDVDVLHANVTWTYRRDTTQQIEFTGTNFYDGKSFIAHSQLGAKTLKQSMGLAGLKVCALSQETTRPTTLSDFIKRHDLAWSAVTLHAMDSMWRAFFGGRCDMVMLDHASLIGVHSARLRGSSDFVVFDEIVTNDPNSPAVRQDDFVWRDLVAWVTHITVAAETLGITQANVDDFKSNSNINEVRRLLGVEPGFGEAFGLDDEWGYRVIKAVGNYGEIFDRNLGSKSRFKMPRGLNKTWQDGGLLYAPPIR